MKIKLKINFSMWIINKYTIFSSRINNSLTDKWLKEYTNFDIKQRLIPEYS